MDARQPAPPIPMSGYGYSIYPIRLAETAFFHALMIERWHETNPAAPAV